MIILTQIFESQSQLLPFPHLDRFQWCPRKEPSIKSIKTFRSRRNQRLRYRKTMPPTET